MDRKYASMIEKGEVNISIHILKKVCDGLKISLSDFFGEIE
ncbi:MAG: helix-turn-helix domain-containing protein [Flavobacteriaceae bacterium]